MRLPLFLRKNHLRSCRQQWVVLRTACYVFSGSEVAIEILSYFWTDFDKWTRGNLWILLGLVLSGVVTGLVCFLYKCAKMLSVVHRLGQTDISIELRVGSVFDVEGDLIIGTNTTFETDMSNGLIAPNSLQGQFTRKYYGGDIGHLNHDLDQELTSYEHTLLKDTRKGKMKRYKIGTVVALRPNEQMAYFVAVAQLNEHGVAEASLGEVRTSLGELWHFIGARGDLGSLVIPVIGTGRARVHVSKREMIREIAGSFIAACSERRFCKRLTIVVYEDDYIDDHIELRELGDYIGHLCQYVQMRKSGDAGDGKAIG